MLNDLRRHDAGIIDIPSGDGGVLLSPEFQGRIFSYLDGELIQRLDGTLLGGAPAVGFNNVGGNYVFPAPEGGPFAFNYLPKSNDWLVQEAFNTVRPSVTARGESSATVAKLVELTNHQGIPVKLRYTRTLRALNLSPAAVAHGLKGVAYSSEDVFEPLETYPTDQVLVAPWSLEQFPGGEGVIAFSRVDAPRDSINFDFYSDPSERVSYHDDFFVFPLGDAHRHQIGIKVSAMPSFVGALDTERSMLMIRKTAPQGGTYFNIADNAQPAGAYSAADLYSIFDGGELGFFELETIGAMQVKDGCVATSRLQSETLVYRGALADLRRFLDSTEGIHLPEEL